MIVAFLITVSEYFIRFYTHLGAVKREPRKKSAAGIRFLPAA